VTFVGMIASNQQFQAKLRQFSLLEELIDEQQHNTKERASPCRPVLSDW
jgi:hypothetical protein